MTTGVRYLKPSEAAQRLGVSAKALRLYEQRGLLVPHRNEAGWRTYGPAELQRSADIVALRALGLSLAQVAGVLRGEPAGLAPALAAHQAALEQQARHLAGTLDKVRSLRAQLRQGQTPALDEITRLGAPAAAAAAIEFELPWPWGGELFSLREIRPLNYLIGPLGSGKTRLALRLAEVLPGAVFLGLARTGEGGTLAALATDPALRSRVDQALEWLVQDGATRSDALTALLAGLEAEGPALLVVDLVEQGLDAASQCAVAAYLRHRRPDRRPLFLLTRSSAILDLASVGADESILFCPANHSPPSLVAPHPGAPGYEAVATCLATPEVRARTEGMIAVYPTPEPPCTSNESSPTSTPPTRAAPGPSTRTSSASTC